MENVIQLTPKKGSNMIKLDYKTLNSAEFNQSLMALANQNGFADFKTSYNVAKLKQKVDKELKAARELYSKWISEFVVKDENGKLKMAEPGKGLPICPFEIIEGKTEELMKKMDQFLETEVEFAITPVNPSLLGTVKLSPDQLLHLEPIFDQAFFAQQ